MPECVRLPVTVTVTVDVDEHLLTFTAHGTATGGRGDDLEQNVAGTIDSSLARATKQAQAFVDRAYGSAGRQG